MSIWKASAKAPPKVRISPSFSPGQVKASKSRLPSHVSQTLIRRRHLYRTASRLLKSCCESWIHLEQSFKNYARRGGRLDPSVGNNEVYSVALCQLATCHLSALGRCHYTFDKLWLWGLSILPGTMRICASYPVAWMAFLAVSTHQANCNQSLYASGTGHEHFETSPPPAGCSPLSTKPSTEYYATKLSSLTPAL